MNEQEKRRQTRTAFMTALNRTRHLHSLTQWQLASGVKRTFFWKTVNGQSLPNVVDAIKLARAAKTTVENLFGHLAEKDK